MANFEGQDRPTDHRSIIMNTMLMDDYYTDNDVIQDEEEEIYGITLISITKIS